jgi:hypothetical protein
MRECFAASNIQRLLGCPGAVCVHPEMVFLKAKGGKQCVDS